MLTKINLNTTAKMKKIGIQNIHEWARYNKNTYSKIEWDSYIKDVLLYFGFWQKKKKKTKTWREHCADKHFKEQWGFAEKILKFADHGSFSLKMARFGGISSGTFSL